MIRKIIFMSALSLIAMGWWKYTLNLYWGLWKNSRKHRG